MKRNTWFINQQQQAWWDSESWLLRAHTHYHPFLGFLTTDVSTEHITVDAAGARQTVGNPQSDKSLRSIFFFGGSTMAGYYATDGETIASYVAQELNRNIPRAVVTNFGQMAFASSQELIYLMLQLKSGNKPDMVVFYDGCNELTLATQQDPGERIFSEKTLGSEMKSFAVLASPEPENRTIVSPVFLGDLLDRIQTIRLVRKIAVSFRSIFSRGSTNVSLDPAVDRISRAKGLVTSYTQNAATIDALARAYGFSYALVWQPMSFTKPLTAQEKKTFLVSPSVYESMQNIYLSATEELVQFHNPHFYDLTKIFSGERGHSIYIDSCHITPQGNAKIASEISRIVRSTFGWQN
ncbi:SGNH/GDSL hydrolase family protein [Candidatus Gottesmanbacteria bacterium]|nr:SGNH/GDSL hydrolase family protein [Candidatus Gottesmanbacteria bacterium]